MTLQTHSQLASLHIATHLEALRQLDRKLEDDLTVSERLRAAHLLSKGAGN